MKRYLTDALLRSVKALPAAAANADCDSIDLGANPYPATEGIMVRVTVPATTALVEDKDITITFQDSADDSTFAAIPELATLVITGAAAAAGGAATVREVFLPPSVRQYLNANAAVETGGGNNTAVSFTLELVM